MGRGNGNNGRARGHSGKVLGEDPHAPQALVPWFVPSLVSTLTHHEQVKGSPLTRDEVERIRDEAPSVLVSVETLTELVAERGYQDIDAESCWEEWQAL